MDTGSETASWFEGATVLRWLRSEVPALATSALAMAMRSRVAADTLAAPSLHPTPVVLVHGLFGDSTSFVTLRGYLAARGIRRFASFGYAPRIDYPRLAPRLAEHVEAVRRETGAAEVDVVGHSLGGLIARYLLATAPGTPIRRLVTLGSPYYAVPNPRNELAIFAELDPLVPAPALAARGSRTLVVRDCGHVALLHHDDALRATARHLVRPVLGRASAMLRAA